MRSSFRELRGRFPEPGHRIAFALLLAALALCFGPPLARDQVLYSHDNATEAGASTAGYARGGRGAFVDQGLLYVPELEAHANAPRRSWLGTWNPHNELGRPLFPTGLSNAYLFGHLVTRLCSDPFRAYTWTAVLSVLGTALCAYGFLRELAFHPTACLTGALSLSVGPLHLGWEAIPLIQWGYCWAFAALWAVERWLARPSGWNFAALAFAVHAVLLSGFPEHFVLLGWMCAGWMVISVLRRRRGSVERARALGLLTAAVLVGVVTVLPAYADLFVDWQRSVRALLPVENVALTFRDKQRAWLMLFEVEWLASVADVRSPATLCLSAPLAGLLALAVLGLRRRFAAYWMAWIAITFVLTTDERAIHVGRWFGLRLSDWKPLFCTSFACAVLFAIGVDRVLAARERRTGAGPPETSGASGASGSALRAALGRALIAATPLAAALWAAHAGGIELRERDFWIGLAGALALVAFAALRTSWVLVPVLALVVLWRTPAIVQWQPHDTLHTDSPLASELRARTADGSRFAWIGEPPEPVRFLAPNQEMLLGLRSIHSYNALVSTDFDRWARRLRNPPPHEADYTRVFRHALAGTPLTADFLTIGGLSTLLSVEPLRSNLVEEVGSFETVRVYATREPPVLAARVDVDTLATDAEGEVRIALEHFRAAAEAERGALERVEVAPDQLEFRFPPRDRATLLFVNQLWHRHWKARDADGTPLATVAVNGLHQGVRVPAGTSDVTLTFEPWSLWMLAPQLGFVLIGFAYAARRLRGRGGRPLVPEARLNQP